MSSGDVEAGSGRRGSAEAEARRYTERGEDPRVVGALAEMIASFPADPDWSDPVAVKAYSAKVREASIRLALEHFQTVTAGLDGQSRRDAIAPRLVETMIQRDHLVLAVARRELVDPLSGVGASDPGALEVVLKVAEETGALKTGPLRDTFAALVTKLEMRLSSRGGRS